MKKYMQGFVPINFQQSGKSLLAIGIICLLLKFISYVTSWFNLPNYIFYLGIVLILLSFYLIFVVPKE